MTKTAMIAKLVAAEGKRDELVAAFQDFFPTVEGEAGTEVYSILTDDGDENVVWVYEVYADKAALDEHSNSEGMKAFFGVAGGLLGGAPEMNIITPVVAKGHGV